MIDESASPAAKKVASYVAALRVGFESMRKTHLIRMNHILEIHQTLERNDAGFRKLPGTALRNLATREVVYTPPQDHDRIVELMTDLDSFINDPTRLVVDPPRSPFTPQDRKAVREMHR